MWGQGTDSDYGPGISQVLDYGSRVLSVPVGNRVGFGLRFGGLRAGVSVTRVMLVLTGDLLWFTPRRVG